MSDGRSSSPLESAMVRADEGKALPREIIDILLDEGTVVAVAMVGEGVDAYPLSVSGPRGTFIPTFSSVERMAAFPPAAGVTTVASVPSLGLISTLVEGVGVLVNPGSAAGFEVPADAVARMRTRP